MIYYNNVAGVLFYTYTDLPGERDEKEVLDTANVPATLKRAGNRSSTLCLSAPGATKLARSAGMAAHVKVQAPCPRRPNALRPRE